MPAEAAAARPVRPGWSTEGQTRFRSRKPAWPSVSIGPCRSSGSFLVDESCEALVSDQRPAAGDRLITSSACRWTVGPDGRPVESDYQTSRIAAVPWDGSFCFPLMAPPMTPELDVAAILLASQQVCGETAMLLRKQTCYFVCAPRELLNDTRIIPKLPREGCFNISAIYWVTRPGARA